MGSGGFIISSEITFQLLSGSRPCAACERFFRPKRHDAHVFVILSTRPNSASTAARVCGFSDRAL